MFGEVGRAANAKVEEEQEAVMEGVEHLGKYVFEMTKAKVEALKAGGGVLPSVDVRMDEVDEEGAGDGLIEGDGDVEEDDEPEEPDEVVP
jgi:intron-binding protein aquarius